MNSRKHLFTVRMIKQRHRLSREMEFPSMVIFKSCLDLVLHKELYMALLDQSVVDTMTFTSAQCLLTYTLFCDVKLYFSDGKQYAL